MTAAAPAAAYLDSSALVKLVVAERETAALLVELGRWQRHVSSALARVEVVRAAVRSDPDARETAEQVVASVDLLAIDDAILTEAARLGPAELRSLDAIHVASARMLGADLGVVVTYDARLARALADAGLPAAAPR